MARYWRMVNVLTESGALELSEAAIYNLGVLLPSAINCTRAPTTGSVEALNDTLATPTVSWDKCTDPGFAITWDLDEDFDSLIFAPQLRLGAGAADKFPIDLTLQYSADTVLWVTYVNYVQATFPGANTLNPLPGAVIVAGDNYYNDVVLLLQDSLTDASSSPRAVSAPSVTVSTAVAKFGGGSLHFDGVNTHSLHVVESAAVRTGTGDFTIEMWVNITTLASSILYATRPNNAAMSGHLVIAWADGTVRFFASSTTGSWNIAAGAGVPIGSVVAGAWSHIAVAREGADIRLFNNGALISTVNTSASISEPANGIYFGGDSDTWTLDGYMDDIRITKGIARYTAAFTVPTAPFPTKPPPAATDAYYDNVVLLLQDSLVDKSKTPKTITPVGNATVSSAQSKFGGSALYFDGSGDSLSLPTDDAFAFGVSDFTLEAWVYPTSSGIQAIFGTGNGSTVNPYFYLSNLTPVILYNGVNITTGPALTLNAWNHVAFTRTNTAFKVFTGGVPGAPITYGDSLTAAGPITVCTSSVSSQFFSGYIDDLRITKGVARYTAAFTPPLAAHPAVAPSTTDTYYDNVVLLVQDSLTDKGKTPKTLTPFGNAAISSAQSKFGGSSLCFDGTGDYLSIPHSTDLDLTVGDFTIEAWIYIAALTSNAITIVSKDGISGTYVPQYDFTVTSAGKLQAYLANGTGVAPIANYVGATTISTNTWHHVALVRSGGTCIGFLDGVQEWSALAGAMTDGGRPLLIGWQQGQPVATYFNGYIDDLRITKGVARYTSGFSVPPAAHAAVTGPDAYAGKVELALDGSGLLDSSPRPKTVSSIGGMAADATQSKFDGSSLKVVSTSTWLDVAGAGAMFGAASFTAEAWVRFSAVISTDYGNIFTTFNNVYASGRWVLDCGPIGSVMHVRVASPFNAVLSDLSGPYTPGAWAHVAWVNNVTDNTFKMFLDGVLLGSRAAVTLPSNANVQIAKNSSAFAEAPYYLDEVRVTKGVARYTSNFVPSSWVVKAAGDGAVEFVFPLATPRPSRYRITPPAANQFAGSPFEPLSTYDVGITHTFFDVYYGGVGVVVGTVKEKRATTNTPLYRRVVLIDEASRVVIRETWSDATTGAFEFRGVKEGMRYTVISYDHTAAARGAVIADRQVPTTGG